MTILNFINQVKALINKYPELEGGDVFVEFRSFQDGNFLFQCHICCIEDSILKFLIKYDTLTDEKLTVDTDLALKQLISQIEAIVSPNKVLLTL